MLGSVGRGLLGASGAGALIGLLYGLGCRWAFAHPPSDGARVAFGLMSVAFVFLVPLAIGALSVAVGAREDTSPLLWALLPLAPAGALLASTFVLAWEGAICLVMVAPIVFALALLGGVATGLILRWRRSRADARRAALGLALAPFLYAPVETRLAQPDTLREVETSVLIEADAATVWSQLVRVPAIQPAEQQPSFFHFIGIPRPDAATLEGEGPGALRVASFHGGIRFLERVDEWRPGQALGFSIAVLPGSVAPYVLDEHVQVGGEHFDVLYGRFVLEPLGPRRVRLRLSSRHRLTTRFNAYAGLWSDAVMRDLQAGICAVIERRSEALARRENASGVRIAPRGPSR